MERNRIRHFLNDASTARTGARPGVQAGLREPEGASFVGYPETLLAELGDLERSHVASMYRQAYLAAEAQVRRAVVERLIASI